MLKDSSQGDGPDGKRLSGLSYDRLADKRQALVGHQDFVDDQNNAVTLHDVGNCYLR
jgi:hypothetical protein